MRSEIGRPERGHRVRVIALESVLRGPGHPRLGQPPAFVLARGNLPKPGLSARRFSPYGSSPWGIRP